MNTNSDQVKDKMVLEEEEKEEVKTDSLSSIGVNSHKDNEGEENEGKEDDMTSVGFALGTKSGISEKYTRSDSAKDLAKPADPVSRKPKKLRPISSRKKKSFKTSEGSAAAGYSAADGLLLRDFKLENLIKIFKCAGNDDIITIKGDEGGNTVTFMFESPSQDKIADFEMKLKEHLGIPDAEYQAIVPIPSAEFARICEDLSTIGDTVVISVTKEGVKFSTKGDFWTANIVCRQNNSSTRSNEEVDCSPEEPQK